MELTPRRDFSVCNRQQHRLRIGHCPVLTTCTQILCLPVSWSFRFRGRWPGPCGSFNGTRPAEQQHSTPEKPAFKTPKCTGRLILRYRKFSSKISECSNTHTNGRRTQVNPTASRCVRLRSGILLHKKDSENELHSVHTSAIESTAHFPHSASHLCAR